MSDFDIFCIYTAIGLLVTLVGINIYRDDLDNHPSFKDTGTGIFLFAVFWPFAIAFILVASIATSIIWCIQKLYEVKIS